MSAKPRAKGKTGAAGAAGTAGAAGAAKTRGRPKAGPGYKMAEKLSAGTLLTDVQKKQWISGPALGRGGFGLIYQAKSAAQPDKSKEYPYVIKIEPHENGPLFVEMHFYMRNAKKEDIQEFIKANKLKSLGMPTYIGSGSEEYNNVKHRFIIMEKFGEDLWNKFIKCNRQFPEATVYRLALQILEVIQYIHERGYVHADIKGANILFGLNRGTENQVYLVDFGLAGHYNTKEYKPDPKKMHNGTIEYTSRDAHNGVLTRRGDLEILGYNLIQWLAGKLPWEDNLTDPVSVQKAKETACANVSAFLKKTFTKKAVPTAILSYMEYVTKMKPDDEPDYKKCHQIFETGLKSVKATNTGKLEFDPNTSLPNKRPNKENVQDEDDEEDAPKNKRTKVAAKKKLLDISPIATKPVKKIATPKKAIMKTIGTQTSIEKLKEVKDGEKRGRNIPTKRYHEVDSSDDECIENSFVETPTRSIKMNRKAKTDLKAWEKAPTIVNGKHPK